MTDPRHAPDTFFLVAEADWRLCRDHCVGGRDWISELVDFTNHFLMGPEYVEPRQQASPAAPVMPPYMGEPSGVDEVLTGAASSSGPTAGASASSSGTAGPPRPVRPGGPAASPATPPMSETQSSFYGWTKASRPDTPEAYISRDLRDLVRIANQAHRYGLRDDVVWYSWVGSGKAKNKPSHGSTLLGVSKTGARRMRAAIIPDHKPEHFDIWLRNKLFEKAHDLSGSYVFPSIGGYDEHISGCDPTNAGPGGLRKSVWSEKHQIEGVRITTEIGGHRDRFVRAFLNRKGWSDEGVKVVFGDDRDTRLTWKTLAPPTRYWQGDETWEELLFNRGWLTDSGWLKVPDSLTVPRGNDYWRRLQADPDGWDWNPVNKSWSPITRIAEQVVCTTMSDGRQPFLTRRARTEHRLNLTMYKRRMFVTDAEQAADQNVL